MVARTEPLYLPGLETRRRGLKHILRGRQVPPDCIIVFWLNNENVIAFFSQILRFDDIIGI
jgi:hypothetical protein